MVSITDIHAQSATFQVGGDTVEVYSHDSLSHPGQHIVKIFIGTSEIAAMAPTRGEAMVELAEYLYEAAWKLRALALKQEGAVKL